MSAARRRDHLVEIRLVEAPQATLVLVAMTDVQRLRTGDVSLATYT